ncbi:aldolase/citrate lyase family protein, partial [Microbispora sp. GKU 823]|uniref:aldolase/citrate lyase family protein n=1 Tax=Microbispora sp. GKU 823 TaxID=1652100 RepID=UPI002118A24E
MPAAEVSSGPAAAPLTWLYVPADRPDRIGKALGGEADMVIVDLEDAVAPENKGVARAGVVALLATPQPRVEVRVNDVARRTARPTCTRSGRCCTAAAACASPGGVGRR